MVDDKLHREWLKERDEMVKSYDVQKFKDFMKKWTELGVYHLDFFPSDEVIEISMRKMVYHFTTSTHKERADAKRWLESRGYTTEA